MKKIGIITIIDNNNYGNRLQNYALQNFLKNMNQEVYTLRNDRWSNNRHSIMNQFKHIILKIKQFKSVNKKRRERFFEFNEKIFFSKEFIDIKNYTKYCNNYDYLIVGSDQVWNPNGNGYRDFTEVQLLEGIENKKKISYAASFGVNKLSDEQKKYSKNKLLNFNYISVREYDGKKIIENLTNRTDVQVLVDPTMLLTAEEWDKVAKKPEQLKKDKYILNYFLGELSENRKKEIERIAKENDCEIINILDKSSPFYQTGPSEFLYLEKNAFLICTDSFHSSVFAILYNRPFIVFEREDSLEKMNSRIDTLLKKFKLQDREFKGTITQENLKHDYREAYEILENEREKAMNFLKKALDIEE